MRREDPSCQNEEEENSYLIFKFGSPYAKREEKDNSYSREEEGPLLPEGGSYREASGYNRKVLSA